MPKHSRKVPLKAQAAAMLPHGLGVVLGTSTVEKQPVAEESPVSNSPSIANPLPLADPIAITLEASPWASVAVPEESVSMKNGQLTLVNPKTITSDVLVSGNWQLRPRNPNQIAGKSQIQKAIPFSVTKSQHADGQGPNAPSKKRKAQIEDTFGAEDQDANLDVSEPKAKRVRRVARKTRDNPYGLTPGVSPFPEWLRPSAEQCEEVFKLLKEMHHNVLTQAPEVIPPPSLEVTGCGEVPSLLDGLLRTYLSTAVSMDGSNKMLQNIAAKFGVLMGGIGGGSVDWNNVRLQPIESLYEAIRQGGLATEKSKNIKTILDMVYEENVERRNAYLEERKTGVQANVFAAAEKTEGQKDFEIQVVEQHVLSLEHLRGLPSDEVMKYLTKYPGIGVKTSACVILFCLQIPCFAVDTHVHRFARWLGWVPPKANADDTFSHLEVKCPDQFKYGLHQLFIQHGKLCGKCKANTAQGTKDWAALDECPLEALIERIGKRHSKTQGKAVKQEKTA